MQQLLRKPLASLHLSLRRTLPTHSPIKIDTNCFESFVAKHIESKQRPALYSAREIGWESYVFRA